MRVLFKSVAVFDLAMTEPIPGAELVALEPPIEPISGDSHAHLLPPLTQLVHELGFGVEPPRCARCCEPAPQRRHAAAADR